MSPNRLDQLRVLTHELVKLACNEDLSPAKGVVSPEYFQEVCGSLSSCLEKILALLRRVCESYALEAIDNIINGIDGIGLVLKTGRPRFEDRQRLQVDIMRIVQWLAFAEQRVGLPSITIDSSSFIHYANEGIQNVDIFSDVETLITASATGKINVAITTSVASDLGGDKDTNRMQKQLKKMARLPIIPARVRLDMSMLSRDVLASEECVGMSARIKEILFPKLTQEASRVKNKLSDIDHLTAHWYAMRDIFVTEDNNFLAKRESLVQLGVEVLNAENAVLNILL